MIPETINCAIIERGVRSSRKTCKTCKTDWTLAGASFLKRGVTDMAILGSPDRVPTAHCPPGFRANAKEQLCKSSEEDQLGVQKLAHANVALPKSRRSEQGRQGNMLQLPFEAE